MWRALLLASLIASAPAYAQLNQAITDAELYEPWTLARTAAVAAIAAEARDADRAVADAGNLDASLAALRARFEDTAIAIVARPEFAYDAAQASFELSREVADAGAKLQAWLADYPAGQGGEAAAARDAIARLEAVLAQRNAFERDVFLAVGSGSKHAIQALARRWWTAAEQVEALRAAVGARRQ
jgi:hypothetical protein